MSSDIDYGIAIEERDRAMDEALALEIECGQLRVEVLHQQSQMANMTVDYRAMSTMYIAAEACVQSAKRTIGTAADACNAMEVERDNALAEVERLKAENMCDACAGSGTPISGLPCMCGGTGCMSDAAVHLRKRLVSGGMAQQVDKLEMEVETLRDDIHSLVVICEAARVSRKLITAEIEKYTDQYGVLPEVLNDLFTYIKSKGVP